MEKSLRDSNLTHLLRTQETYGCQNDDRLPGGFDKGCSDAGYSDSMCGLSGEEGRWPEHQLEECLRW